jgi:FkbM family methyltransferase
VFDGARLLHRGGMVQHGERIALQVVFAEPRSLREKVSARLEKSRAGVGRARAVVAGEVRDLRRRVGRTAIQYSPAPAERLSRTIARLLPPVTCVDIGASYYPHGPWEVFRRSPQTLWIAVEPNSQNTGYLNDWHWPAKTRLEGVGLSEYGGEQTLYVTNTDSGSSLLPPVISPNMEHRVGEDGRCYFFPVTEKPIPTRSLPDVVADTGSSPLVVKLDTQGTELSILRGAQSLFDARRIVGIETEATLLAEPYMAGSGKFWEVCQFLEARGFELLQLKPIEALPTKARRLVGRTYLNECDAVFALKHDVVVQLSEAHQLTLLGFYASYQLYEELEALLAKIPQLDSICARAGVTVDALRKLLA